MLINLILYERICLLVHWVYCSEVTEDGTWKHVLCHKLWIYFKTSKVSLDTCVFFVCTRCMFKSKGV